MSVVRVTVRKARVGEYPFVAQKSSSTASRRGGPDNFIAIVGDRVVSVEVQIQFVALREDGGGQQVATVLVKQW